MTSTELPVLTRIPRQRLAVPDTAARVPNEDGRADGRSLAARATRATRAWRSYVRMSICADPLLTSVWVNGHCLDVSIYDQHWLPEQGQHDG